jgi:hypothetical protein
MAQARGHALLVLIGLAATACGGDPAPPPPPAIPYQDPGAVEAGAYRLRYALTLTTDLPAEIAGSYGIVQRRNLALLVLTLERRDAAPGNRVGAERVEADAISLTGERHELELTRHEDPGGPTWLAPVEVRHRVPLAIEIRANVTSASPEIRARLTREFRLQ